MHRVGKNFDAVITGCHGDPAEFFVRQFLEYVEKPKAFESRWMQEGVGVVVWQVEPNSEDGKIATITIKDEYPTLSQEVSFFVNIKHFLICACMEFKKNVALMQCEDFSEKRSFQCDLFDIDELLESTLMRFG